MKTASKMWSCADEEKAEIFNIKLKPLRKDEAREEGANRTTCLEKQRFVSESHLIAFLSA